MLHHHQAEPLALSWLSPATVSVAAGARPSHHEKQSMPLDLCARSNPPTAIPRRLLLRQGVASQRSPRRQPRTKSVTRGAVGSASNEYLPGVFPVCAMGLRVLVVAAVAMAQRRVALREY